MWLAPLLLVAWIVVSSLGRGLVLRRVDAATACAAGHADGAAGGADGGAGGQFCGVVCVSARGCAGMR